MSKLEYVEHNHNKENFILNNKNELTDEEENFISINEKTIQEWEVKFNLIPIRKFYLETDLII